MARGMGSFSSSRKGPLFEVEYAGECRECFQEIMPGWLAGYVHNELNCQECWDEAEDE